MAEYTYEFDPVKDVKSGDQAVVWTTKSLQAAVDAMEKGLPLKVNPFCGRNTKLLKPDLVYKRTEEEIEDYIKCMQDPIYFAEKCSLMTPEGLKKVKMRDYQVEYLKNLKDHRFNVLLSCRQAGKSVTNGIFCLWKVLFNIDKNALLLSKSGPAGRDILVKIKDMFLYLPYHLKVGVLKWNQSEISFDNNSSIHTEAFSETAGLGQTINFLMLDEFAWCPQNQVELFYTNIIPTITTMPDSNVVVCSTQNGFNKFYEIWNNAITGKSIYYPTKVDWWQVPNWNPNTKQWEKRTEKWKEEMIGVLGSEEAFYYQYGTQFSASSDCLASREVLTKLHERAKNFIVREDLEYESPYKEYLYFDPDIDLAEIKNNILILIDLAEGGGGDYTVFNIFKIEDKDTFVQIGYWRSNDVDIEHAALGLWLLCTQLFNQETLSISIEWNTYGAIFYNYLMCLNDDIYFEEFNWRFNIAEELDLGVIARYKKGDNTEDIAGLSFRGNYIPGIRFNGSNKVSACSLLKMAIEKDLIKLYSLEQICELENFEDKHGNGSYKASYGHDDMMMPLCQIPFYQHTNRYKEIIEIMEENNIVENSSSLYDDFNIYNSPKEYMINNLYQESPLDIFSNRGINEFNYKKL